nr:hypothetical protein [Tanacetum cinerariifolium]
MLVLFILGEFICHSILIAVPQTTRLLLLTSGGDCCSLLPEQTAAPYFLSRLLLLLSSGGDCCSLLPEQTAAPYLLSRLLLLLLLRRHYSLPPEETLLLLLRRHYFTSRGDIFLYLLRFKGFDRRCFHWRFMRSISIGGSRVVSPSKVHDERLHQMFTGSVSIGGSRGAPPSEFCKEHLYRRFTRSASIGGFTKSVSIKGSRGVPPSKLREDRLYRRLHESLNVSSLDLGFHLEIFISICLLGSTSEVSADENDGGRISVIPFQTIDQRTGEARIRFLLSLLLRHLIVVIMLNLLGLKILPQRMPLLAEDDLDDLIIKYKIPRDLHPQLPLEEFMMPELPDDTTDAGIDNPRPTAGSFSMADVRRLSAHVIKLRDMPDGVSFIWVESCLEVLVLSGLSRVWKSRVCDPVLQGADENVMGIHYFLCLPEWTGA